MSIARALVEKHGKIAAVLLPASVLGGFAYSAATGTSPIEDSKKWMQGEATIMRSRPEREELCTASRKGFGECNSHGGSVHSHRPFQHLFVC